MVVYAFDGHRELVKIVKRGRVWAVYPIKKIEWWKKYFSDPMRKSEVRYKFIWEKRPINTYTYKPYEDKDVSDNPEDFIEDVETWQSYVLRYVPH